MHETPDATRIKSAISEVLATEALDINVQIYDHRVVLSGVVDVLQDKRAVEETVQNLGIDAIENKITVVTDGTITDSEIKEAVERKLTRSKLRVPAIEVYSGKVQLRGHVSNLEEVGRIAERASEVLGVAEVDTTQLRVDEGSDDATLKNRIEAALANITSAPDVDTTVHNSKVELRGYVPSLGHADEVKKAVAAVDGIQRLETKLEVRPDQAHP